MNKLVTCICCKALYNLKVKWVRGYYEGTSMTFNETSSAIYNHCPVCNTKYEENIEGNKIDGTV